MIKKLAIVIVGILVAVLVLSLCKDMIAKTAVERGAELVTGLKLRVSSFKLGIIKTLVGIRDLKLYNPRGYKDKIMVDMPQIYVEYDLPAIFKNKIHLQDMRIDLKEFYVIKNEKGELNLDSLKVVKAQKEGKKPESKGKAQQIQIDNLQLKIGKVIYKDYSSGGEPSVKEFNVNLNESYKNINNPYALASLIVVKALMNTTIASLTNFDLGGLKGTISDTLGTAQKLATETVAKAQETAKQATEAAKKTAEGLKDAIKLPFGAKEEQ
jgi:hypothetical protein